MAVLRHERFSNLTATLLTILLVALFIATAWLVYFLWVRFQLVQFRTLDYVVLAIVALGVPFAFDVRRARREQRSVWRILANWSSVKSLLGVAVVTGAVGGAALEVVNGFLDHDVPTVFAATVVGRCYRGRLPVAGAPNLPTPQNSLDLETFPFAGMDCHATHVGDTILISVKRGHLRRPWISGYQLLALSASTQHP